MNNKKELIKKIFILLAPVLTIVFYCIPYLALYGMEYSEGAISYDNTEYIGMFSIYKSEAALINKIIITIALVGVVATLLIYILSFILKNHEKILVKAGAITLVASSGILALTNFFKHNVTNYAGGVTSYIVDFMTPLYGILICYNVATLILLFYKKSNEVKKVG